MVLFQSFVIEMFVPFRFQRVLKCRIEDFFFDLCVHLELMLDLAEKLFGAVGFEPSQKLPDFLMVSLQKGDRIAGRTAVISSAARCGAASAGTLFRGGRHYKPPSGTKSVCDSSLSPGTNDNQA